MAPLHAVSVASASTDRTGILLGLLKSLVNTSLKQGNFTDVYLLAYSRRLPSGQLGAPCPVYANSAFLKTASPYFRELLSGSSGHDTAFDDGADELAPPVSISPEDFGAEDSDLEDEEEDTLTEIGQSDDGISIMSSISSTSDTLLDTRPQAIAATKTAARLPASKLGVKPFILRDAAFVTWEALIYFLYTGEIAFAPLRSYSPEARLASISVYKQTFPDRPTPCSPKSMYRLADMIGANDLKALAFENIRAQLSHEVIASELFSRFSSTHTEVLELETTYLAENRANKDVADGMKRALAAIACQKVPHAVGALQRAYDLCVLGPAQVSLAAADETAYPSPPAGGPEPADRCAEEAIPLPPCDAPPPQENEAPPPM